MAVSIKIAITAGDIVASPSSDATYNRPFGMHAIISAVNDRNVAAHGPRDHLMMQRYMADICLIQQ